MKGTVSATENDKNAEALDVIAANPEKFVSAGKRPGLVSVRVNFAAGTLNLETTVVKRLKAAIQAEPRDATLFTMVVKMQNTYVENPTSNKAENEVTTDSVKTKIAGLVTPLLTGTSYELNDSTPKANVVITAKDSENNLKTDVTVPTDAVDGKIPAFKLTLKKTADSTALDVAVPECKLKKDHVFQEWDTAKTKFGNMIEFKTTSMPSAM